MFGSVLCLLPLAGYGQKYANSPFYRVSPPVPSSAHHPWQGGPNVIEANGISIDLSESTGDHQKLAPWSTGQKVDGTTSQQILHFFIQYDGLGVVFAYDLLAEPVVGTSKIKCTFSSLTLPQEQWGWNGSFSPVPLSADLTPIVIESGNTLAIDLLPLGDGETIATEYIRLSRATQAAATSTLPVAIEPAAEDNASLHLLKRTAENYQKLTAYSLHATVELKLLETSWHYKGELTLAGPHREVLADGTVKMAQGGGQISCCQLVTSERQDTGDQPPSPLAPFQILGHFDKIADDVVRVKSMGSEVLQLNGKDVECEVLKVNYVPSTYEHSHPEEVTYWIDAERHLILSMY